MSFATRRSRSASIVIVRSSSSSSARRIVRAGLLTLCRNPFGQSCRWGDRQGESEGRALAGDGACGDIAVVPPSDLSRDRKADAGAVVLRAPMEALERTEDPLGVLLL